ncbi:uncharacterized protein LOC125027637 isoform X2 [Penaeus chinensis]|uniref:uncharacterized protein LOC125027637 isoform X2 n=1 Tax=Penaeus chinensis TaxID=139456 RepID=UPI001FB72D79|nr:uncharacterized protein LOC125027637 isoform X2 [Penaeus chinensis]
MKISEQSQQLSTDVTKTNAAVTITGTRVSKKRQTPIYHQFVEAAKLNPRLSDKEHLRAITIPANNDLEDPEIMLEPTSPNFEQ